MFVSFGFEQVRFTLAKWLVFARCNMTKSLRRSSTRGNWQWWPTDTRIKGEENGCASFRVNMIYGPFNKLAKNSWLNLSHAGKVAIIRDSSSFILQFLRWRFVVIPPTGQSDSQALGNGRYWVQKTSSDWSRGGCFWQCWQWPKHGKRRGVQSMMTNVIFMALPRFISRSYAVSWNSSNCPISIIEKFVLLHAVVIVYLWKGGVD